MPPLLTLTGQSNKDYVFTALPLNQKLPSSAGVYVVTNAISNDEGQVHHTPLQIESCSDLSKLSDESAIQNLRTEGATMICVKIEEVMEKRQQIERELKAKYLA